MDQEAKEVHEEEIEVEDSHAPEVEEEIVDGDSEKKAEEPKESQKEEATDKQSEAKDENALILNEGDFKVDIMAYFEKTNYLDREAVESHLDDIIDMSTMTGALMGASEDDIAAKKAEVKSPILSLVYSSPPYQRVLTLKN